MKKNNKKIGIIIVVLLVIAVVFFTQSHLFSVGSLQGYQFGIIAVYNQNTGQTIPAQIFINQTYISDSNPYTTAHDVLSCTSSLGGGILMNTANLLGRPIIYYNLGNINSQTLFNLNFSTSNNESTDRELTPNLYICVVEIPSVSQENPSALPGQYGYGLNYSIYAKVNGTVSQIYQFASLPSFNSTSKYIFYAISLPINIQTSTLSTTTPTTIPPPPPSPQFSLSGLINSIITSIQNFLQQYFSI